MIVFRSHAKQARLNMALSRPGFSQATPAASFSELPPVVIAMPHRGVTASTGIEALGKKLDVPALELRGLSVEFMEQAQRVQAAQSAALPASAGVVQQGGGVAYDQLIQQGWYTGWRIDHKMNPQELTAVRAIMATPDKAAAPLLAGVDYAAIIKKLYKGSTLTAELADRFYLRQDQAYNRDVPALQQQVIHGEQALRIANARANELINKNHELAQEVDILRRHKAAMVPVLRQIREAITCPICTGVALFPKVVGACGHITCESCFKKMDEVTFASLTGSGAPISALQHLKARRCPLCRTEIIGDGFPVHPLKDVAAIVANQDRINGDSMPASASASAQSAADFKTTNYQKDSAELKRVHLLQMGCYVQAQLAQHTADTVIASITPAQWVHGVYVHFEAAISNVFFDTFSSYLNGKAGGVKMIIYKEHRMLAVQLEDKQETIVRLPAASPHIMLEVATDGRITTNNAVEPRPNNPSGGRG